MRTWALTGKSDVTADNSPRDCDTVIRYRGDLPAPPGLASFLVICTGVVPGSGGSSVLLRTVGTPVPPGGGARGVHGFRTVEDEVRWQTIIAQRQDLGGRRVTRRDPWFAHRRPKRRCFPTRRGFLVHKGARRSNDAPLGRCRWRGVDGETPAIIRRRLYTHGSYSRSQYCTAVDT
jgi:hypothetical protein